MKTLSIVTIIVLAFFGCKDKKDFSQEMVCTELLPAQYNTSDLKIRAASLNEFKWPHSINFPLNITVKFLNGSDFQKNKVREFAKIWNEVSASGDDEKHHKKHKINLLFVPYDVTTSGGNADIRILFQDGKGSASRIGSDCRNYPQDQPTMFFGWVNENYPDSIIRQVVLHEFGHALGLIHEHQNPTANIPWNPDMVYYYYKTTQDPPWDRAKVDANIFYRYSTNSTNYTAYDPKSIMHYAIPSFLTTNGYSTPFNPNLSSIDSAFIKKIYPYSPCTFGVDCCFDKKGKRIPCP